MSKRSRGVNYYTQMVQAVLLAALAAAAVGCGKGEDPAPPPAAQAPAPAQPIPSNTAPGQPVPGQPVPGQPNGAPIGNYFDPATNNWANCPTGYFQNGNVCAQQYFNQNQVNCGYGQQWGGYGCMPQGFNYNMCPGGTQWNWGQQGCFGYGYTQPVYYPGFDCMCQYDYRTRRWGYVYFYVGGAPSYGTYFNGYGWARFGRGRRGFRSCH